MTVTAAHIYKDIDYSLKKSDRKTTSIYIERDGSVSVLAPKPFDMARVEALLEKKRSWIYRSLAEWDDLNRTRVTREYVNGESFLYLGRSYQLEITVVSACIKNSLERHLNTFANFTKLN
jgi:predicted metal-dependent hydrolase